MSKDIFISYSSIDKVFAHKLASNLKEKNVNVWLDAWDIGFGGNIVAEVNRGLAECRFLLVILSRNSLGSKWVEVEWTNKFGDEINKGKITVIPTVLGELEDDEIPLILRGKRRVNLSDDYESELSLFVQYIMDARKDSLFEGAIEEEHIKQMLIEKVTNSGIPLLKNLRTRLENSASRSAEFRIGVVKREIDFAYRKAKDEEDRKKEDFAKDPDRAEFLMMLVAGREEAVIRKINDKLSYIIDGAPLSEETVDAIIFEIDCLSQELLSSD